jgi:PTS system nitrogen regulatory IIA component
MNLSKYLHEECIQVRTEASNKLEVLKTIAQLARNSPLLKHIGEEEILEKLKERERLGSTGLSHEIAIPHCRLENVSDFVVGIVMIPEGVDFESIDNYPTKLFVFIIAPTAKQKEHVHILSNISNVLRFPQNVQELLAKKDAATIREYFLRHTNIEKGFPTRQKEYQQLSVIVQHEEIFHGILTIFAEIQGCYVSVLDANNARQYLYALPLFALFWNEEQQGFQRIILAIVPKVRANEAIRKMNVILEDMKEETGVLLWLQDIAYINGSLDL